MVDNWRVLNNSDSPISFGSSSVIGVSCTSGTDSYWFESQLGLYCGEKGPGDGEDKRIILTNLEIDSRIDEEESLEGTGR